MSTAARWSLVVAGALLALAMAAAAQTTPVPPAAEPRPARPELAADPSARMAAMARERALVDSVRRASDSILAARRRAVAQGPAPRQSPMFGDPPFFGYTWVFYADVLVGVLVGHFTVVLRRRRFGREAGRIARIVGSTVGAMGGAAVFMVCFMLSGLLMFMNPPGTGMLFGITAFAIVYLGAWVVFEF